MATFHCSVKVGKSGTGAAHADYIEREGKYASKDKDDLEYRESGNMPEWAEKSGEFWKAADGHERAKGSVYREFEIALPRELTKWQRLELVHEFIAQEIGENHAYTFAIHNPKAAIDGGEQPHAHIMFSERKIDGIARPAEQYFKRWNAKNPERGGCQKASTAKTPTERKAELVQLRERFADLQNKHLTRQGHAVQVTHLSLAAQGIDRKPEEHFGPKVAKAVAKQIADVRQVSKTPSQTVQNERGASKTPDAPKPPTVDTAAAVDVFMRFNAAYFEFEKTLDTRKREEAKVLAAAREEVKDKLGLAEVYVHQHAQLGKRPALMNGKWDAQDKALRAQFAEAKQAGEQAQERIKASEERSKALKELETPAMKAVMAIRGAKLTDSKELRDQLSLGQSIVQAEQKVLQQQVREQAKAQEQALQKTQQPDKGKSR